MSRFADRSARMRAAVDAAGLGAYWGPESRRMMERIEAFPDAALFSSVYSPLHVFGGGAMQPDDALFRRPVPVRALSRLRRTIGRLVGGGRRAERLGRLVSDDDLVHHALIYSRANYRNAVLTGYLLLRDAVESYDVRAHAAFGDQRVEVAARLLTWPTLLALRNALVLRDLVGTGHTVLEIGAGIGELSRMLLRIGVAKRVVIIDIPPALAFSQEHLAAELGDDAVGFYDASRTKVDPSKTCTFLMPHQLTCVPDADVGVNMGSFQEMPAAVVRGYADACKRLGMQHFVSVNTRAPHPVNLREAVAEPLYTEAFGPEFRVAARLAWPQSLDVHVAAHAEAYQGYQGLHFVRST